MPVEILPLSAVCPICQAPVQFIPLKAVEAFTCRVCGRFEIGTDGGHPHIPPELRPYLSAETRQATLQQRKFRVTAESFRQAAEAHQRTGLQERFDKLLRFIAEAVKRPGGDPARIATAQDYPVADAYDRRELVSYLDHLSKEELVTLVDRRSNESGDIVDCVPTMKGWQRLDPARLPGGEPGRCFVASWLGDEMDEPYRNGFDPAIRECGYTPVWMKDVPENKGITDRIMSEVQRAEFVVADLTGQRQNVYFEAGFARGLGREVIWCCRADHVEGSDGLHFDVRHFGHVVWRDSAELRAKLTDSIRANILHKS
jgi:hypothetical protein